MLGKRVQFDEETWQAIDLLGRDSMKSFQELADEAFADLLKKHGRPTDLNAALRASAGDQSAGGRRAVRQARPQENLNWQPSSSRRRKLPPVRPSVGADNPAGGADHPRDRRCL